MAMTGVMGGAFLFERKKAVTTKVTLQQVK